MVRKNIFAALCLLVLVSCGKQEEKNAQLTEETVVDETVVETPKEVATVQKSTPKEDVAVQPEIDQMKAVFSEDEDVLNVLDGLIFYNTDGKDPGASVAFRGGNFIHNDGVVREVLNPTLTSRGDDRAVFSVMDEALGAEKYVVTFYGRDNVIILDMADRTCAFALAKDMEE